MDWIDQFDQLNRELATNPVKYPHNWSISVKIELNQELKVNPILPLVWFLKPWSKLYTKIN